MPIRNLLKHTLVAHPPEIQKVKDIVRLHNAGLGATAIVEWLDAHDRTARTSSCWTPQQVYRVLKRHLPE